ncbi:hypothetical protein SWZG_00014 [Synechococcus phage S-SKS1]|uniref:Uncharacterized protein n=1 Tax=Synechococcus phage S-SKS1 TaxID=754042 RepID=M4R1E4_9CAUD|nr:hypothetical protein SWZG_00014 [Synechococcus phage S-SKS1]AGH31527.1 hypothetical protein SWZG_00014 [Synechococcus phage S-SKS1]
MNIMEVNQQYYKYWKDIWCSQSQEVLDATALIRVVECTNGCIQHAFRDGDERALSVEQSRECMKLSMGTIKNKVLPLPDGRTKVILPEECHEIMNTARDLYVRGFKQGDEEALDEFFALSKAHFQVLGRQLIDEKFRFFAEHFEDVFTSYWIMMGRMYIYDMGEFI